MLFYLCIIFFFVWHGNPFKNLNCLGLNTGVRWCTSSFWNVFHIQPVICSDTALTPIYCKSTPKWSHKTSKIFSSARAGGDITSSFAFFFFLSFLLIFLFFFLSFFLSSFFLSFFLLSFFISFSFFFSFFLSLFPDSSFKLHSSSTTEWPVRSKWAFLSNEGCRLPWRSHPRQTSSLLSFSARCLDCVSSHGKKLTSSDFDGWLQPIMGNVFIFFSFLVHFNSHHLHIARSADLLLFVY